MVACSTTPQAGYLPSVATDRYLCPWVRTAILTATILLAAIPFTINVVDPDLWGHVQYGQDWLATGTLPRTATHTYADPSYPWINHENLAELALASGFQLLGNSGMLVAKGLLGISLLLVLTRYAQARTVSVGVLCCLLGLVAGGLHVFWLLRPQLATFTGLTLWILVLDLAFSQWHDRGMIRFGWLWCFPLIELFWTNAHGGFLAGWVLLGVYLTLRTGEAWLRKLSNRRHIAWHLGAIVGTTGLTMFVNPYGFELVWWLIESLRRTRPEIIEWGRPDLLAPMFLPFFALLFGTMLAWCVSDRRKDWVHACIIGLLAWQALSHIRHIGLFVIVTAFWSCEHFEAAWQRLGANRMQRLWAYFGSNVSRNRWQLAVGVLAVVVTLVVCWPLAARMATLPVDRAIYPVDAVEFMVEHEMQGRLVVSFNWAQYAIAALQPKIKVGFDGRFDTCYAPTMIDMHFDLLLGDVANRARVPESGEIDPTRALVFGDPDLVLLDRSFPHSVDVMTRQPGYVLVYQDGIAQLWGRRDVVDDIKSPAYIAVNERHIGNEVPQGTVAWPAVPPGRYEQSNR